MTNEKFTAEELRADPAAVIRASREGPVEVTGDDGTRILVSCPRVEEDCPDIQDAVTAFHEKFGYPVRTTPTVPDDEEVRFRLRLVAEEFFELLDAALQDRGRGSLVLAKSFVRKAIIGEENGIGPCTIKVDMVEFADALTDLDYVIEGTRLTFGIDGRCMLKEVQRANMAKTNEALKSADAAKRNGTRKAQKPPGWTPPDVSGVLKEQGWVE